jgi:hypothetical protein
MTASADSGDLPSASTSGRHLMDKSMLVLPRCGLRGCHTALHPPSPALWANLGRGFFFEDARNALARCQGTSALRSVLGPSRRVAGCDCGLHTVRIHKSGYTWSESTALYRLTTPPADLEPRYNICPTTRINIVVREMGETRARPDAMGPDPVVVEEGDGDAGDVQGGLRASPRSRCFDRLSSAPGYYEWHDTPASKQPYYCDEQLTTIAGLWDEWKDPETGERPRRMGS